MVATVEHCFGCVNKLPDPIEWLTDTGSCYVARSTRNFAIGTGLEPRATPIKSPEGNGMAGAFVRTFKRDYVEVNAIPDAQSLMSLLPTWSDH
jgi:putative transposase